MVHRNLALSSFVPLVSLLALLAGCSSNGNEPTKTDENVGKGDPSTEQFGESLKLTMTVPNVPPGEEGTKCLKVRLNNEQAAKIGKVHNLLSPASHHLVVSSVEDPAEEEEPLFECRPFKAVLIGAPFTVTQRHDDLIEMPKGVGFPITDHQLMHLEMHYINTGTETQDVTAESELFPLNEQEGVEIQEASFLIVGDMNINVPANSRKENPTGFVKLPDQFAKDEANGVPGVNFYASTGHTHRFGTHAELGTADSDTDEGTTIYNPVPYSWTDAPLQHYDPPFQINKGGGFRFNCAWENPTSDVITYGESALQEMCFFWAYYYPRTEGPRTLIILPKKADPSAPAPAPQ